MTSPVTTPTIEDARTDRVRSRGRVLRFVGKTCLALAALLALYLAWLIWGTGLYTAKVQQDLREDLAAEIEDPRFAGRPPPQPRSLHLEGDAWAILKIPDIELDVVVVEGVSPVDLKAGPGHYVETAFPWQPTGTVGIAGHRTTYGAPFWSLDELEPKDPITLVTEFGIFRYQVRRMREVDPSAISVLEQTEEPTLILTTCSPRFSASRRLIVVADRV